MTSDIKLTDTSVILEGSTTVLQSGNVRIPVDAQGYPGMLRIEFDGVEAHAGRLLLAPAWLGRAMMVCNVETVQLQSPKVPPAARAALSHSQADELVLNDGKHYAGGVSIHGAAKLEDMTVKGAARFEKTVAAPDGIVAGGVTIAVPATPALQPGPVARSHTSMEINSSTIRVTTTHVGMIGHQPAPDVLDLVAEIRSLRDRVAALEKKAGVPVPA
ncbi:hypothetical protein ACQR05_28750 [Bradyrhizobium oligotrophicum]|uniref:hypothetical protein n=1 Tax=Bradyrhizobium oligotrophicum TaxID=44255 RepID=UPI003EB87DE0